MDRNYSKASNNFAACPAMTLQSNKGIRFSSFSRKVLKASTNNKYQLVNGMSSVRNYNTYFAGMRTVAPVKKNPFSCPNPTDLLVPRVITLSSGANVPEATFIEKTLHSRKQPGVLRPILTLDLDLRNDNTIGTVSTAGMFDNENSKLVARSNWGNSFKTLFPLFSFPSYLLSSGFFSDEPSTFAQGIAILDQGMNQPFAFNVFADISPVTPSSLEGVGLPLPKNTGTPWFIRNACRGKAITCGFNTDKKPTCLRGASYYLNRGGTTTNITSQQPFTDIANMKYVPCASKLRSGIHSNIKGPNPQQSVNTYTVSHDEDCTNVEEGPGRWQPLEKMVCSPQELPFVPNFLPINITVPFVGSGSTSTLFSSSSGLP